MPAERLHQDGELDRAAAAATILRRERQAEPAELGRRGPDLVAPAGLAVGDLAEATVVVALGQEFFRAAAQDFLLGAVSEIHGNVPEGGLETQTNCPISPNRRQPDS